MSKILIISPSYTHPTTAGNRKCIMDYCNMLRNMGCDVYLLLVNYEFDYLYKNEIECTAKAWGNHFFLYQTSWLHSCYKHIKNKFRKYTNYYWGVDDWYPSGLTNYINRLHEKHHFDSVIVNYIYLSKVFCGLNIAVKALYTHDVFIHKSKRVGFKADFTLTPSEESKGLMRCNNILSIQENETQLFHYLAPRKNIYTVYSYFAINRQPLLYNSNLLFFSGSNQFNINGIKNFIYDILPIITNVYPNICLLVGGKICDVIKEWKIPKNVILKGLYDNPEEFYALGDIAINPTYQGTGLKIKTFEAMSYGKITLANEHSCEGIYQNHKSPIFITNNANDYINALKKCQTKEDRNNLQQKTLDYMMNFQNHVKSQFSKALNL